MLGLNLTSCFLFSICSLVSLFFFSYILCFDYFFNISFSFPLLTFYYTYFATYLFTYHPFFLTKVNCRHKNVLQVSVHFPPNISACTSLMGVQYSYRVFQIKFTYSEVYENKYSFPKFLQMHKSMQPKPLLLQNISIALSISLKPYQVILSLHPFPETNANLIHLTYSNTLHK